MVKLLSAVAALVLVLTAGAATASTIVFDNLGPDDTYDNVGGWFATTSSSFNQSAVTTFTPTGTGELDELWAAMWRDPGPNELTLSLCSDGGSEPGGILWQETFMGVLGSSFGDVLHLSGLGGPTITAGVQYWLIADGPDEVGGLGYWYVNNKGDLGLDGIGVNDWSAWTIFDDVARKGLRVGVTPIPEPATMLLAAAGLLGLVLRRRS